MDTYSLETNQDKLAKIVPISRSKLYLLFEYGDDFHSSSVRRNILKIFQSASAHIVFAIIAVILLFSIRRKIGLRRDGLISVYIDVIIVVAGGGSLRYQHRLEKVFFGILLLGVFFINTIAIDNFLFCTYLTEDVDRIDTIEKFIKFNPPIFINRHLKEGNNGLIVKMLR